MKKEKSNNLLEEKAFLENQLEELRKLPFIRVKKSNATEDYSSGKTVQGATPTVYKFNQSLGKTLRK